MKMESKSETSHINTFIWVLSELSAQGVNFEEEVNALDLLSSLPASWEVFCTTFANNRQILNLDEMISQVLTKDIQRKSMGLNIDESAKAHHSTESIDWSNLSREQAEHPVETLVNRERGEIDQEIPDPVISALIVGKLVIIFPTTSQLREKRATNNPSGTEDDPTQIAL